MMIITHHRQKIAVMHMPYRKKPCLATYDEHTNVWYKMATFNNDQVAEDFMEYLARFVGAEREEE